MKSILSAIFALRLLCSLGLQLVQLSVFLLLANRTARLLLATLTVWFFTAVFILVSLNQVELKKRAQAFDFQQQQLKIQAEIVFWEQYFALIPTTSVATRLEQLYTAVNNQEKADFYRQSAQSLFPPTQ